MSGLFWHTHWMHWKRNNRIAQPLPNKNWWGLCSTLYNMLPIGTLALAVLRLSRLVTTDALGDWFIRKPVEKWANEHEIQALTDEAFADADADEYDTDNPITWQKKAETGMGCPFCVGFWLGAIVLTLDLIMPKPLRPLWKLATSALALNYVTGHISSRLD